MNWSFTSQISIWINVISFTKISLFLTWHLIKYFRYPVSALIIEHCNVRTLFKDYHHLIWYLSNLLRGQRGLHYNHWTILNCKWFLNALNPEFCVMLNNYIRQDKLIISVMGKCVFNVYLFDCDRLILTYCSGAAFYA